jgi:aromatic ring-cleaving dioxygenase
MYNIHGRNNNFRKVLVWNALAERAHQILICRWEDNSGMGPGEVGCGYVN